MSAIQGSNQEEEGGIRQVEKWAVETMAACSMRGEEGVIVVLLFGLCGEEFDGEGEMETFGSWKGSRPWTKAWSLVWMIQRNP